MKESRSWISLKQAPMSKLEVKVLTKALRKEGCLDLGRALSRTSSSPGIFGSADVVWGLFGNKQQWVGMEPGSRRSRASLGWAGGVGGKGSYRGWGCSFFLAFRTGRGINNIIPQMTVPGC